MERKGYEIEYHRILCFNFKNEKLQQNENSIIFPLRRLQLVCSKISKLQVFCKQTKQLLTTFTTLDI